MYVLWTIGKLALHNNINNIDEGELLPTSGTKQLSSRDSKHLTRDLSRSLCRTHPFGIGWTRQLLLRTSVRQFVHLDLLLPHQIRLRWGSKYAKKRWRGLYRVRGSGLFWTAASRLGLATLDCLAHTTYMNVPHTKWMHYYQRSSFSWLELHAS